MFKKITALFLSLILVLSISVPAFSASEGTEVSYKITNPYKDVEALLAQKENHYKTNLHTHSTVSDGSITMPEMIKTHYEQNFDILAMAEHGVRGKKWFEEPTHYFLMQICAIGNSIRDGANYFSNQFEKLSAEEYKAITEGTYEFDGNGKFNPTTTIPFAEQSNRTYGRGLNCVTTGIELSAASILENHVNSYFSDWGECISGLFVHEGDYEYFIKNTEKSGGISVINHPGHYLNCKNIPENAKDKDQLFYFSNLLNTYKSCLGIETFNNSDSESRHNRIFWDELLQYVIPYGERNVFGFGNSDAHEQKSVDSSFMDFVLPSFSEDNLRKAMETGSFFATGRRARTEAELGDAFAASGAVPLVTCIDVDDDNDVIIVKAKNADRIEWVANGSVIEKNVTVDEEGQTVSVIKLREHSDDITCYVRFQIFGKGGYCYSNPFICDDGNMQRFIIKDTRSSSDIAADKADRIFTQNIIGALVKLIEWKIENNKVK